jgi:hypothetical protein
VVGVEVARELTSARRGWRFWNIIWLMWLIISIGAPADPKNSAVLRCETSETRPFLSSLASLSKLWGRSLRRRHCIQVADHQQKQRLSVGMSDRERNHCKFARIQWCIIIFRMKFGKDTISGHTYLIVCGDRSIFC